jgi:UV DNA damage endonuclease
VNQFINKLPKLGLVCITAAELIRFRTITRTRLLKLADADQREILRSLYQTNLARFQLALNFCHESNIRLYRMTARLFPFADEPMGAAILAELEQDLAEAGQRAHALGIRLVVHPDQFVVLSSDSAEVIQNSIKILNMHGQIMDMLQQPRSPWATIELHGGKASRAERLVAVIQSLPEPVRSRLALENDEYAYSAAEINAVCRQAGIPMVFDAHHHICYEGLDNYEDPSIAEMLNLAAETWPTPAWQLVHISNGRDSFTDRRHSDFITELPGAYRQAPWIEVEAKQKERAIAQLRVDWLKL